MSGRLHLMRDCSGRRTADSGKALRRGRSYRAAVEGLEGRALLATSSLVYPGADGNLLYAPDAMGNRVEDFSDVGYMGGTVPLPDTPGGITVPVQVTLSPTGGDQTARIQAAIDQVSQRPLDADGYRGAVLLEPGTYPISGQLTIQASGVVLLGSGNDPSTGTVLEATGTSQRTLIQISGSGSPQTVAGTTHNITDPYVPVGAISFHVDSTAGLQVGDTIDVHRPSPANWIDAIGMNTLTNPWQPGSKNLNWDRVITHIDGNQITVDAPLTNALDQTYGGGTISEYTWPGRLEDVGVANLYAKSDFTSSTDENHSWTFIGIQAAENSWVHDVVSQYFAFACVELDNGAKWITVQDSQCLDPISQITGGRRYSFDMSDGTQLALFLRDYARNGRHDFTVQTLVTGPNAFVDCHSDLAYAESGPHQRWSNGTLFDNVVTHGYSGSGLNIRNAGNEGTGHGWQAANDVIWNSTADGMNVSSPPTAQNWVIGGTAPTVHGDAIFDSFGTMVSPQSLYEQQLSERLARNDEQEVWLGDIDNFTPGDPADQPPVDPTWLQTVQAAAGSDAVVGFDDLRSAPKWIPFTFNFDVPAGERVISASLSLAMRGTGGGGNDSIYLNSLGNSYRFSQLGWTIPTTGSSPRVLDLSTQLGQLQGGQLNVAVADDVAIDWAVIDVQLAPTVTTAVDLSTSFNRVGIVSDGATFTGGGLDGHGYAYSANLLGPSVTADGATFNLGPAGANDAVQASGQTIALPQDRFSALAFLGTGVNGNQPGQTFTVTYVDGTVATFSQGLSDWGHPQSYAGESTAVAMPYRDKSDGTRNTHPYNLYLYTLTLDPSKAVSSITLPNDGNVRVLAMDLIPATSAVGPMSDGGFETPSVGTDSYGAFQYDPGGIPWAYSGSAGVAGNDSGFTAGNPPAPEGTQVGFLQETGSFSQTVAGWPAGSYVITFDAAQRGNYQASQQDLEVLVDGAVVGTFTPSGTSYQGYSTAAFTVAAGSHNIAFQGLDSAGGDNTAFLDDIRIASA